MIRRLVPLLVVAVPTLALADKPACKTASTCWDGGHKLVAAGTEAQAVPYLEQGCKLDSQESCDLLAVLLVDGRGVAQDVARAHELWDAACAKGEPNSCSSLALELEQATPPDRARALVYYTRGCQAGGARACRSAGRLLDMAGAVADEPQIKKFYDQACKAKDTLGCAYANDLADRAHPVQRAHVRSFTIGFVGAPLYDKAGTRTKADAKKLGDKLVKSLDGGAAFESALDAAAADHPTDQTLVLRTHEDAEMMKLFNLAPKHAYLMENPSFGFVLWYRD